MSEKRITINRCAICPYFGDDTAGMVCYYNEKNFPDSFDGEIIPDWCQLPDSDTLPEWLIAKLNRFIENNSMSESGWFIEWKDCCKWILSLRKPEDK